MAVTPWLGFTADYVPIYIYTLSILLLQDEAKQNVFKLIIANDFITWLILVKFFLL